MMHENVIIKNVEIKDTNLILFIEKEAFGTDCWDINLLCKFIDNSNCRFIGAYLFDDIIGYGIINDLNNNGTCEIINLAIKSEYRKKGIGTELMKHMIEIAKKNRLKNILLEVSTDNIAISIYKKLGFKEIQVLKNYYTKSNKDAVLMKCELL